MPKMTTFIKLFTAILSIAALFGCGTANPDAAPAATSGKHADNWVQQHWVAYKEANGGSSELSSQTVCSQCHGLDLAGGISKVSCFSATFNGMYCHANADHTLGHPAGWLDPTSSDFHGASTFNGAAVKGATNLATACGLCHAVDANGTSVADAPSCLANDPAFGMSCHFRSPATNSTGCVSCHSVPPGSGAGNTAFPNEAGAHAKHVALPGVTCSTCHNGFGTGTARHATSAFINGSTAFVGFPNAYLAKGTTTGGFTANDQCYNVSCHGGKLTPDWNSGSINVSSACLSCHEQGFAPQTPQYNSFYSGLFGGTVNLHQFHLSQNGVTCTSCHNINLMSDAVHFANLATPGFETAPGATVGGGTTFITSYTQATKTCNAQCHSLAPATAQWQ